MAKYVQACVQAGRVPLERRTRRIVVPGQQRPSLGYAGHLVINLQGRFETAGLDCLGRRVDATTISECLQCYGRGSEKREIEKLDVVIVQERSGEWNDEAWIVTGRANNDPKISNLLGALRMKNVYVTNL